LKNREKDYGCSETLKKQLKHQHQAEKRETGGDDRVSNEVERMAIFIQYDITVKWLFLSMNQ
jgi:hypothetical protein